MFADADDDDDDATTEGPTMPPGKIDVSFCLGVILGSGLPDFGVSVGVCVRAASDFADRHGLNSMLDTIELKNTFFPQIVLR